MLLEHNLPRNNMNHHPTAVALMCAEGMHTVDTYKDPSSEHKVDCIRFVGSPDYIREVQRLLPNYGTAIYRIPSTHGNEWVSKTAPKEPLPDFRDATHVELAWTRLDYPLWVGPETKIVIRNLVDILHCIKQLAGN